MRRHGRQPRRDHGALAFVKVTPPQILRNHIGQRVTVDRRHEASEILGPIGPVIVFEQPGGQCRPVSVAPVKNRPIPYVDLFVEVVRLDVGDQLRDVLNPRLRK